MADPERKAMKRLKEYIDRRDFVADAEYGIPTRCLCGGGIVPEMAPEEARDFLPGKRFFTCNVYKGRAPKVNYMVNSHNYDMAYYLTDGIYPKWATFIQSITLLQGRKAEIFAKRQEAVRKDVERAFGVLQARFAIVKKLALLWDKEKIGKIVRSCIILHNMIVEDEREGYTQYDISDFLEGESSRCS